MQVKKIIQDTNNKWCFREQTSELINSLIKQNQPLANGNDSYRDFGIINKLWKL